MNLRITIFLVGRFRIETENGDKLVLKSAKAQGLVALLATSPGLERGRKWLQDKLWSDRGPEQGAASLRQALTEIRKSLGIYSDALLSDRQTIGLNKNFVEVSQSYVDGSTEFLEGIDVRDPEFEHWLNAERITYLPNIDTQTVPKQTQVAPSSQNSSNTITIAFSGSADGNAQNSWDETLFIDAAARSIREAFSLDVIVGSVPEQLKGVLVAKVQICKTDATTQGVRVELQDAESGKQYWSGFRSAVRSGAPTDDPKSVQLINMLVETISDVACQSPQQRQTEQLNPKQLCRIAIRKLFSMNKEEVAQADKLLERAYEIDQKGVYLAWRAQVRTVQLAELHNSDKDGLRESAKELYTRALEIESNNSMILSSAANSKLFIEKDVVGSLELSKRSVAINAANPFGWWALSAGNMYNGDVELSYKMAKLARKISIFSPHGFWWDLQQAASALVSGQLVEATTYFERASAQCPEFRPPLRYLAALYASNEEFDKAHQILGKLEKLEPDFTLDRLLDDPEYPSSLLKRAANLKMDRLAALS